MDYTQDLNKDVINPLDIRKQFKKRAHFMNWCFDQSEKDLNSHLRVFLEAEHYEDCAIIRDVLNLKKN